MTIVLVLVAGGNKDDCCKFIRRPMKICTKCKEPNKKYWKYKPGKDGLQAQCTDCIKEWRKRVEQQKLDGVFVSRIRQPRLTDDDHEVRKIEMAEYQRAYREANKNTIAANKKDYVDRVKSDGIELYGSVCSCCGEYRVEFLTIEHINGRDKSIKKRTGKREWARLKSLGWPKEDITLLCFNCNCSKGAHGYCPHEKE